MATRRQTRRCHSDTDAYYRKPKLIMIEDMWEIEAARRKAMIALPIIKELQAAHRLTIEQKRSVRNQALRGDIDGAWRELARIKRWIE